MDTTAGLRRALPVVTGYSNGEAVGWVAAHLEEGGGLVCIGEPGLQGVHIVPLGRVPFPEHDNLRHVPVVAVQHHQIWVAPMLLLEQLQPLSCPLTSLSPHLHPTH